MESFVLYRFFRQAFGIQPDDFMVNRDVCVYALQCRGSCTVEQNYVSRLVCDFNLGNICDVFMYGTLHC